MMKEKFNSIISANKFDEKFWDSFSRLTKI